MMKHFKKLINSITDKIFIDSKKEYMPIDDLSDLKLVNFWISNFIDKKRGENKNRKIPEDLKNKYNYKSDDIHRLQRPYKIKGGCINLKGLTKIRNNLLKNIRQEKILNIQQNTKYTQYIIASVMVFTALLSFFTLYTQIQLDAPQYEANLDCFYEDGFMIIEPKLTNHGKIGAFVSGKMIIEGDIILEYFIGDRLYPKLINNTRYYKQRYLEGGNVWKENIKISTQNITNDINISFSYDCNKSDWKYSCKFISTNTVSCPFVFENDKYTHIQQCIT